MRLKVITVGSMLAVVVLLAPLMVQAQGGRGQIRVTNNWDDTVTVTLWKQRGEQMSRQNWTIAPGQVVLLAGEDGRPLWVRGSDKIKAGEDWGRVDIGRVGQFQRGAWRVNVREIWRATHQRRDRAGVPPDPQGTVLLPNQRR